MTSSVYRAHTAIMEQTEETMKADIVFGLFEANVPVKNFQSCWDGATASWVLPVLLVGKYILLKDKTR